MYAVIYLARISLINNVFSDTHSLTHHIKFDIPDGDIFM